jgi:protein tyrosine/serine phosphatase
MPFENLNNNHYLAEERTEVNNNLTALEATLNSRIKNLNAEGRQKYGSVGELNKLVINKVRDYRSNQPSLSSPDVDWDEFQNDYESREFLQGTIARLQNIIDGLSNNKILHDYDNYQAALTDYDFTKYKAATKAPGFENKVNDVAQFFNRTGSAGAAAKTADTTTAS